MVAWGGKARDCEWLFRVTEVDHYGVLSIPQGLDFFLNPCFVIKRYSSCRLNNVHTGPTGYGLEMTWCHMKDCDGLPDAHSSLAGGTAQTDVVLHPDFLPFIDKSISISVCSRLLMLAGLVTEGVGRVLYTDSFYTSISLMEFCFARYGFVVVCTYSLTSNVSRAAPDFPFHKLSNSALRLANRGWTRRATRNLASITLSQRKLLFGTTRSK
jgi:hypothetical protein